VGAGALRTGVAGAVDSAGAGVLATGGGTCAGAGNGSLRTIRSDGAAAAGASIAGVGRIDQRRILADQPALAPIDFDQEAQRRYLHRHLAADADHRAALAGLREAELQVADQAVRALQPDPGEGRRRGQRHARVFQLARFVGDHRDLGQERLAGFGQDADVAQSQRQRGLAAGQQQQRARRTPAAARTECNGSAVAAIAAASEEAWL
jgi:hypothetical protein